MEGKLLTISVAAYNVEKYLDKLLDTIIDSDQLDKIEILIINDGSKDKTAEIGMQYEEKYPYSIHVINKENGGHGSTINKGIELAAGKYFKAIDGDDWVDPGGLKQLVHNLINCSSDLVICNFKNVYEESGTENIRTMQLKPSQEFLIDNVADRLHGMCYHNVFYKTSILQGNKIRLTEHSFYVDNELVCYPIPYLKTVTYYDEIVYCYRLGRVGQSISTENVQKNELQHLNVCKRLMDYYHNYSADTSFGQRLFMEKYISTVVTFQLDIQFSFPASKGRSNKLIEFDNSVKQYPYIYDCMVNKTYRIWRLSRRVLYGLVHFWVNKKWKATDGKA